MPSGIRDFHVIAAPLSSQLVRSSGMAALLSASAASVESAQAARLWLALGGFCGANMKA